MAIPKIKIEVAYARPDKQWIIKIEVEAGTTLLKAIQESGICELFPEIDLNKQSIGVFSEARQLTDIVKEGDRIEIYRPLMIDPKEARRKKVKR